MVMLLGKKIGMTRIYNDAGQMVPVTVLQAGPCKILQVKTTETDGYNALQLGFENKKPSRSSKPAEGHAAKADAKPSRFVREWRLTGDSQDKYSVGDQIGVSAFAEVKFLDVIGISKGKGYAGVMKRHHFGGFPASHGTERKHRAPGSQASHGTNRGHGGNIKKGKRMAGRMGGSKVTTKNHRLISIDEQKNLIVVKGAVAGPSGGYVEIRTSKSKAKVSG